MIHPRRCKQAVGALPPRPGPHPMNRECPTEIGGCSGAAPPPGCSRRGKSAPCVSTGRQRRQRAEPKPDRPAPGAPGRSRARAAAAKFVPPGPGLGLDGRVRGAARRDPVAAHAPVSQPCASRPRRGPQGCAPDPRRRPSLPAPVAPPPGLRSRPRRRAFRRLRFAGRHF